VQCRILAFLLLPTLPTVGMRVSARTLAKGLRAHLLGVLVVEFLTQHTFLVLFLLVGQFNVRRHIHPHVHHHLQEKLHEFSV
jgi:uncharacterized membrane protein